MSYECFMMKNYGKVLFFLDPIWKLFNGQFGNGDSCTSLVVIYLSVMVWFGLILGIRILHTSRFKYDHRKENVRRFRITQEMYALVHVNC